MEMVRKDVAAASLLVLLIAGCGSSRRHAPNRNQALDQSAARFAVQIQAQLLRGEFTRAWRTLYPTQKRVVSAERLSTCYPRSAYPSTVTFRATEVRDVAWTVPGTTKTTPAKELTITATSRGRPKLIDTQHVVRADGGWTWMLSAKYFGRAKRGAC
jgi:hypothetical protein